MANDQEKERGEISLLQVSGKDMIKSEIEREQIVLESKQTCTGVKLPGQLCLSTRGIKQTVVDGCMHADGSSELG